MKTKLRLARLCAVCFFSAAFSTLQAQVRETIAILGDSYSTYEHYLTPSENRVWYHKKTDRKSTDVEDVRQTWWWQVVKEGGYKLGVNNSFSGSTICYTGYDDKDASASSFISRLDKLGNPDIILIFGATNDSWAGVPLGEFKYENFKRADLFTFRPAMAYMLQELQSRYPNVKLYFLANDVLKDDVLSSIQTICGRYQVKCIRLKNIDKQAGHPNVKGMRAIADQVLKAIK